MRVVFDTDVMVAALRSPTGASRAWLDAALRRRILPILSVPLVLQYEDVLTRPEQLEAIGASGAEVGDILDALCAVGEPVEISFLWRPTLRDPGDELVLETAVNGRADWLLTFNERDFAGAERFRPTIIRPGPAWRQWQGGAA